MEDKYLPEQALRVALGQVARLYAEVATSGALWWLSASGSVSWSTWRTLTQLASTSCWPTPVGR
jgi:hypothetical protein